jgi:hypothetical protein
MNSRRPLLLASIAAALVSAAPAAFGFAEIARGALTLTTQGSISYDSNVSGNAQGQSDVRYGLAPTFNYKREAGLGTIDASLGMSINRYRTQSRFDGEDYRANLQIGFPFPEGDNRDGSFSFTYNKSSDIDPIVGQRLVYTVWKTSLQGGIKTGPRTRLLGDAHFTDTDRGPFANSTHWGLGGGFEYSGFLGGAGLHGKYSYDRFESTRFGNLPALDQRTHQVSSGLFYDIGTAGLRASGALGYQWLQRGAQEKLFGDDDVRGLTFDLRLTGPFLPPRQFPKLDSSFSLGFERGRTLGYNDNGRTTLVGSLGLSWQARDRTSLHIRANRTQSVGATNLTAITSRVSTGINQSVGQKLTLSASTGHEWREFRGLVRSDRTWFVDARANYALTNRWAAGASVDYRDNRTDTIRAFTYERYVATLFTSFTF